MKKPTPVLFNDYPQAAGAGHTEEEIELLRKRAIEISKETGIPCREYHFWCPMCGTQLYRQYFGEKINPIKDYYSTMTLSEFLCPGCQVQNELLYKGKGMFFDETLKTKNDYESERNKRLKLSQEKHDLGIEMQKFRSQHYTEKEEWRKEREKLCAEIDKLKVKPCPTP